jgi:dienelactone hydrolase
MKGTSQQTQINGLLYLPPGRIGRAPLVIISIGSRGFESGRETLYTDAFNQAGIAVLIGDSFGSRGFAETRTDQSRISAACTCADAVCSFNAIADDPRIDASRVAILGYSRGGTVSMLLADQRLQDGLLQPHLRFSAHVALYAGCSPRWESPRPTSAPILMVLGGADVLAPPEKSLPYGEKVRRAGGNVEIITFPGAHHSFDALHAAKVAENGINLSAVAIEIDDAGEMFERTSGLRAGEDYANFYKELARKCGTRGSITGNGPLPRDVAVAPIIKFVRDSLGLR